METKTNYSPISLLAVLSLTAGGALLGYSLHMLPAVPAYGFPWAFAGAVLALLPIATGGWCFGTLVRRQKSGTVRYGHGERSGGVIFALLVIMAGILLLCFNSEVLPLVWRRVFFSWQMLLLAGSMVELGRGRFVWGGILLAAGGFLVIRRLEPLYPDLAASGIGVSFWPVLLIVAGMVILGGLFFKPRRKGCCNCHDCGSDGKRYGSFSKASGMIDISTVFGGSEQVYLDPVFCGGKISAVFGGVKLDLRRTELPEGETFLQIESVFGGVEIDTPEEWIIEIRNESVFGGFADKRLPPMGGYTSGRKLIIKAGNVFGGGEVK